MVLKICKHNYAVNMYESINGTRENVVLEKVTHLFIEINPFLHEIESMMT